MAEEFFEQGLQLFQLAVMGLVYVSILINVFTRKGTDQLYFFLVLAGYFYITAVISDFFLATAFIAIWFIFTGSDFFVPKYVLIAFIGLLVFVDYSNPVFFLIAITIYTITTVNFIFASFRRLNSLGIK